MNHILYISKLVQLMDIKYSSCNSYNEHHWYNYQCITVLILIDVGSNHSFFLSNFTLDVPSSLYGATLYAYCWIAEKKTISTHTNTFWRASSICSTSSQTWWDRISPNDTRISSTIPCKINTRNRFVKLMMKPSTCQGQTSQKNT